MNRSQALPGDLLQYDIQIPFIGGTGGDGSFTVDFADQVPDGFTISGAFCQFGSNYTCDLPVSDNETGTVTAKAFIQDKSQSTTVQLLINGSFDEGTAPGTYTNTACVTPQNPVPVRVTSPVRGFAPPECGEGTLVSADVEVVAALPDVPPTITKSVNVETASAGDILTYTVTYQSTGGFAGPIFFPFYIVLDDLPDNATYVEDSYQCTADAGECLGPAPTGTYGGDTLGYAFRAAEDDPNQQIDTTSTYQVQIDGDVAAGDTVTNSACIAFFNISNPTFGESDTTRGFAQTLPPIACIPGTEVTTTVTIVAPSEPVAPTLTKVVDNPNPVPGETVTYTVVFAGTNAPSQFYTIGDDIPDGLTLDPASVACTPAESCLVQPDPDGDVIVTVNGAGETSDFDVQVTYQATVDEDVEIGTVLTNLACATELITADNQSAPTTRGFAQAPECGPDDPQDSVDLTVSPPIPPTDPVVTKDVSSTGPESGDVIGYTVRFQSSGNDAAYQLVDDIPDGETLVGEATCTATVGTCAVTTPTDDGDISAVVFGDGPQSSIDVTISYQVQVDAGAGTEITNTACATPAILGLVPGSSTVRGFAQPAACDGAVAQDSATITVTERVPGEFGQISKTVNTTEVNPGDPVTYTVAVSYTGGEDATPVGARIEDTVPATLTGVTWTCTAVNAVCGPPSGSGNEIVTEVVITDGSQDATITLTIEAVVSEDAEDGPVTNEACTIPFGSSAGPATRGFAQEPTNCASADIVVSFEPVPGPEETTTPVPGTPVPSETPAPGEPTVTPGPGEPTVTPPPGEPTKTAAERNKDVLGLPSTGSGPDDSGFAIAMMIGALGLILLAALAAMRRSRGTR